MLATCGRSGTQNQRLTKIQFYFYKVHQLIHLDFGLFPLLQQITHKLLGYETQIIPADEHEKILPKIILCRCS